MATPRVPVPQSPFCDPKTGIIAPEWYLYLNSFNQTTSADTSAAMAAANAAQSTANTGVTAAAAAQSDATALKAVPYVEIAASATTPSGRSLAVAASLKLTDSGAGNPVTLAIADLQAVIAPTLLNSWVDYGAPFNTTGYYKDPMGIVHLRGMVKNGVATAGTVIFTLPAGYRPANRELFAVSSNDAYGRVDVLTTGDVVISFGSATYVSFDGITFRAA